MLYKSIKAVLIVSLCFPGILSAAVYNADTNGDGIADEITAADDWLHIKDGSDGTVNNYFLGSYTFYGIEDTNGQPGQEVIATQGNYLVIVDNNLKTQRSYSLGNMWTIHFVVDTDGNPGADIVTITQDGLEIIHDATGESKFFTIDKTGETTTISVLGHVNTNEGAGDEVILLRSDHSLLIVEDNVWGVREVNLSLNTPPELLLVRTSLVGFSDTDGLTGKEIIIWRNDDSLLVVNNTGWGVSRYAFETPFSVFRLADTDGAEGSEIIAARNDFVIEVISDSSGSRREYERGTGTSIYDVKDTDGDVGGEIIFGLTESPYSSKIVVIDDAERRRREYDVNSTFDIIQISNLDAVPGDEICYSKMADEPILMAIVDRKNSQVLSEYSDICSLPDDSNVTPPPINEEGDLSWLVPINHLLLH